MWRRCPPYLRWVLRSGGCLDGTSDLNSDVKELYYSDLRPGVSLTLIVHTFIILLAINCILNILWLYSQLYIRTINKIFSSNSKENVFINFVGGSGYNVNNILFEFFKELWNLKNTHSSWNITNNKLILIIKWNAHHFYNFSLFGSKMILNFWDICK